MKSTVKIVADHRERASGIVTQLQRDAEIELIVAQLEFGDYDVAPGLVLERKSAEDFSASIVTKRLFTQIAQVRATGRRSIYIVEGNLYTSRLHPNAIMGALSYLTVLEEASILPVANAQATAVMIKTIARHVQQGLGYELNLREARPKSAHDQARYLLQGLPGIGLERADALLAHFGSPGRVLTASEAELEGVPGIGRTTAKQIRALLDSTSVSV